MSISNPANPSMFRGKSIEKVRYSLAPVFKEKLSKLNAAVPALCEERNDTNTPSALPKRRCKELRLREHASFVSSGTRAQASPNQFAQSIAVTPYDIENAEKGSKRANFRKAISKASKRVNSKKKLDSNPEMVYFPVAVHALVTETAKEHPEIIDWIENGEAFIVKTTTVRFFTLLAFFLEWKGSQRLLAQTTFLSQGIQLETILKRHFRHGKFTSLQRQLNST